MKAEIQVQGVRELRAACKAVEDKISISQLKEAHARAAEMVRAEATKRMPHRSGTLAGSYTARGTQTGGYVQSKLDYAGVQEFGGKVRWRPRGKYHVDSQGRVWRSKPHLIPVKPRKRPSYYIYPTIEDKRDEIIEMYRDVIYGIAHDLIDGE